MTSLAPENQALYLSYSAKIILFRDSPIPKSAVGKPPRRKVRLEHRAELETARRPARRAERRLGLSSRHSRRRARGRFKRIRRAR